MQVNPYTPRSPLPATLAGRHHELAVADQVIAPVLRTKRAAEGGLVLFGVRGIGKTATLRAIARHAQADLGFVTVWASAAKGQPFLPSLAPTIRTTLENNEVLARDAWSLESLGIEIGLGPVKASATASRHGAPEPSAWSIGDVERLLRETARLCAEARGSQLGSGMLLFVDELHAVPNDELAVLLNALQNIAHDEFFSPPFAFFAAGLPSIRGIATVAATFGERTEFLAVPSLTAEAVHAALSEPAAKSGVGFDQDALEYLAEATRGYPFFVQLYGYHTWAVAHPSEGSVLTLSDAKAGVLDAHDSVINLYTARYEATTPAERAFVIALAETGGDDPVRRADIATALGRSTQAISDVRDRLIDKAVIVEETRGFVKFTLPGFAQYVLDEQK